MSGTKYFGFKLFIASFLANCSCKYMGMVLQLSVSVRCGRKKLVNHGDLVRNITKIKNTCNGAN